MRALEDRLKREVEEFHDFIAAWFRGDVERFSDQFQEQFAGRLGENCVNIQPSGAFLSRDQLVDGIWSGYGNNPDFRIRIDAFVLRDVEANRAFATYTEHQFGARNTTPADNQRVSTVLFQFTDTSCTWLHIHETGLN